MKKFQIKTKFVLAFVLFWSIVLIFALVSANSSESEVREGRIIIEEPAKNGSFFIASTNVSPNEVISPVLRTNFTFNALYLKWQTNSENANLSQEFDIYVKFLNETWSDWLKIELDDDINGKDNSQFVLASQLIPAKLTDTFQYKIIFDPHVDKATIKNLEFTYLDTTKGPRGNFKISAANNDLNIITRAQWGANENYKYDSNGADLWEQEYYAPKKFIIHHTAGENANLDPMATIRAIQYWHAVGQGWGDIGYNYLIDSNGTIYEGRIGGDGVVAGHAYMNNRNSIGIAILGCYQSDESDKNTSNCNTPDNLTEATKLALNKLIAVKSREFNIDPLGQNEFNGQMLPNIIGHRDVGNTVCPGNLIYEQLQESRQLAYNLLQELGGYQGALPASAQFVRQSSQDIAIEETKTADVIVEFKNTGQAIWRGYDDAGLFIADSSIKNKLAQIGSVKIALNKNYATPSSVVKYKLIEGNVYPGETGRFRITLAPSASQKTETLNFTLAWDNKGYFPNSDFSITTTKVPCTTCQPAQPTNISSAIYAANLEQSTFPKQIPAENTYAVSMQFKNSGNKILNQDNLKLKIIYEKIHISPFRNNSWYSEYAMIPPKEPAISPGAIATFEFNLQAPNVVAAFPHTVSLFYNDQELAKIDQAIEVTSPYACEITANTLPVAVLTSWRPSVKLTFKNSGSKTWSNPVLKSYDIDYTNSWFRDWSWDDNKTIAKKWQNVEPGEEITFEFKIKPYWKPSTYPHLYKLSDDSEEIYINGKKEYLTYTRVDN